MVSSFAILSQVLLATAALARPSVSERVARRAAGLHQSRPKQLVESVATGNSSHVDYSSNWSGAVLSSGKVRNFLLLSNTFDGH